MQELLITGATGSMAPFLIHALLHEAPDSYEFVCLVRRSAAHENVRTRIGAICAACAERVVEPRFRFIPGDLNNPLSYSGSADAVWHFAADLRLDARVADEVRAANMNGTRNILEYCERSHATLYHVSTAYVCGRRTGKVTEHELFCGQGFRNAYEESKAECEGVVQRWLRDHPGIVFRPSIVVGHTETGVSLAFHGIYKPATALWMLRRVSGLEPDAPLEFGFAVPCFSGDSKINVVAVDYVTSLLLEISRKPEALGKTFHVANPDPPTLRKLFEATTSIMGVKGMRLVDEGERAMDVILEKARGFHESLVDVVRVGLPYFADDHPQFDMSNVEAMCGTVPPHPPVDEAMLGRLYRYAMEQGFRSFS